MIKFFKPTYVGSEDKYVLDSMKNHGLSGDGHYSKLCHEWFESHLGCVKALLTPSCTHALEMAAILLDIKPGDEVIMPSYTFVSTANAFVLRGAKIIFIDIQPEDMNMDISLVESAITDRTRVIVPVHYAGISCDMDALMDIANKYGLFVVEDAAQGVMSAYKNKPLGTLGHLGAFSFHETKNYTSGGEGGLLIVNDKRFKERAEIIREKGTNRNQFFRGMVDKYSWVDVGSSYLMSDLQAAYLWGQLKHIEDINSNRLKCWNYYLEQLSSLKRNGHIDLPELNKDMKHNGHMFYIKLKNLEEREAIILWLKSHDICAAFHYVPLHSSKSGAEFGKFHGVDKFTTRESERLLRLPIYYGMKKQEQDLVVKSIKAFFS